MAEYGEKERAALKGMLTQYKDGRVSREPTDEEIDLLIVKAERTGLDPFAGHIYGTWRGGKFSVESTIDGFFSVAESTKEYAGTTKTRWCDKEGNWFRPWLKSEFPAGVEVGVKKVVGGQIVETEVVARWDDYVQGYRKPNGSFDVSSMWKKMGPRMLEKCGHALALRQAFPKKLGGLYTAEEMMQADNDHTEQVVERVQQNRTTTPETPPRPSSREETGSGEETPAKAPTLSKHALDELTGHIKLLIDGGLKVTDICNLFGAAGLDGPAARSKKAIMERLKALTPDEANKMNLTFAAKVEQVLEEQAAAAKKDAEPTPEDEALAALGG